MIVSYKLDELLRTILPQSFIKESKRPAHLPDIERELQIGRHTANAVITMWHHDRRYGFAQMRSGIRIMFKHDSLDPKLNLIYGEKKNKWKRPRVRMEYEVYPIARGKVSSIARALQWFSTDPPGKGPLDSGNESGFEWDWSDS